MSCQGHLFKKKKKMFLLLCAKSNNGSFYQKQTALNIEHLINTRECEYNSYWDMA